MSIVQVPSQLRVYGGGWRMDSLQSMPGMLLLRENHLQAARTRRATLRDMDAATKLRLLANYWQNDATGGNPIRGLAWNLFASQTRAQGKGAVALDFLLEELVGRLFASGTYDFSAHYLAETWDLTSLVDKVHAMNLAYGLTSGLAVLEPSQLHPSTWDRILEAPLAELDVRRDPREALGVLRLKSRTMADTLDDVLGRWKMAEVLATMRQRHFGKTFGAEDFIAAIAEVDENLGADVRVWLYEENLPGFLVSDADVFRLSDDERGRSRYQILFRVRNDEHTPGWVNFQFGRAFGMTTAMYDGDPARIAGRSSVEVGLVSRVEPSRLFVTPYLALNRRSLYVSLDGRKDWLRPPLEAFSGTRPSRWRPQETQGLVVDDLDPGFSARTSPSREFWHHSDVETPLDSIDNVEGALPVYRPPRLFPHAGGWAYRTFSRGFEFFDSGSPSNGSDREIVGQWYRQELPSAWGKYRRTVARTRAGAGEAHAIFTAEIPASGRWLLHYHLPDLAVGDPVDASGAELVVGMSPKSTEKPGTYYFSLHSAGGETAVRLDPPLVGLPGWVLVGEFVLDRGKVDVVVSNRTSGQTVVADAIRWNLSGPPR